MRAICVLLVLTAAPVLAADPKPDFTVKAEEFAKEAKNDPKAFTAKYAGKTVEVTGTVQHAPVPNAQVWLNGFKEKPNQVGNPVFCSIPAKLDEQLRWLARGQQLTVRGKVVMSSGAAVLDDCEFVKVGPSTAVPTTLAALDAEFKKNREAADKKYDQKSVVVRVKVGEAKTMDSKVVWTVADVTGKGAVQAKAWADPLLEKKFQEELEKVKVGDVIVLIGRADSLGDSFRLWDTVVLKGPPPGVKLPGDKK